MQRKKDDLKITNLLNNSNKIIHSNNNMMQNKYNKYQGEQIFDNNNTNINETGKSTSKSLGRKRKFK